MRNKKQDYQSAKLAKEGLDKIFSMVSKKINENRMPRTPEEKIRLAEQMKEQERIFQKARQAEHDIVNLRKVWKDRREYEKEARHEARLYRREKIKERVGSIWGVIKDVHK